MSSWLDEIDCLGYTNAGVSSGMYAAQILKSIAGQSLFQLVVMYAAVFHADALFGVPNAGLADGPSLHYTLVFNVFVMMQLFNQVSHSIVSWLCLSSAQVVPFPSLLEGLSATPVGYLARELVLPYFDHRHTASRKDCC